MNLKQLSGNKSRRVSDGENDEFLNQIKEEVESGKKDLDKAACELYEAGYFDELPFNRDVIELCNIDMNKYKWVGDIQKKLYHKTIDEAKKILGTDWTFVEKYEGGFHDYYYKFVSGDIKEDGSEEYITLITDGKYIDDVWTNMNEPYLMNIHRFNDSCKVKDSRRVKDSNYMYADNLSLDAEYVIIGQVIGDVLEEMFAEHSVVVLKDFLRALNLEKGESEADDFEVQHWGDSTYTIYFYKNGTDLASISFNIIRFVNKDFSDKILSYFE